MSVTKSRGESLGVVNFCHAPPGAELVPSYRLITGVKMSKGRAKGSDQGVKKNSALEELRNSRGVAITTGVATNIIIATTATTAAIITITAAMRSMQKVRVEVTLVKTIGVLGKSPLVVALLQLAK